MGRPYDDNWEYNIDPLALCSMFDRWLDYFGKNDNSDRNEVLTICRRIIPKLRQNLAAKRLLPSSRTGQTAKTVA
ncbi:hypothetical protein F7734_14740 [Scytonema sp. UIC 10036]|uniref:hypothetical protein n=1 Tax=Scytonema sp. UIC 10036 TaxID=2304196 RepID=UPI0012DA7698|nr:hypothetical protein [Scytonema sp. UIC 10036]MUG93612.1 hypothetical protein [Scytonema sp. UIC 10036]